MEMNGPCQDVSVNILLLFNAKKLSAMSLMEERLQNVFVNRAPLFVQTMERSIK
jgi:hypothetical protein